MADEDRMAVRDIVERVLAAPASNRDEVLDRACAGDGRLRARVLAMLETVRAGDREAAPGIEVTADVAPDDAAAGPTGVDPTAIAASHESVGAWIDRYRLLEPIGEGGFGTVWAAEQKEPVKRHVALKIIKLGMDTRQVIARFEAERQALAMMDHPHIARVLDAGSTETGRPYFVMELVRGVPIVEYCDTARLDTVARLELFIQVCHAIQHAHQKGIIHRDIKPSNVLVTLHDGAAVPKVIDFGIAKATNQQLTDKTIHTRQRQMIGTPAYMSPEQAEMSGLDVDTRSDVYALGVLLYELLTGTTPFTGEQLESAGFEGMRRLIRDAEPHPPSTRLSSLGDSAEHTARHRRTDVQRLGALLRGDLDWIVMKCLEKDRTRRYDAASALAADVRRHLDDEPVVASPPSTVYRLRKFVKRHRGRVVAGGLVAAVLVLGIVGTTAGLARALREKDRADEQAAIALLAAEAEQAAKLEAQANEQRAIEAAERAEAAEADATERAEELELVAGFQSEQLSGIDVEAMGRRLREAIRDAVPEQDRPALDEALASVNFTSIALGSLEANVFERSIEAIDEQFEDRPLLQARLLRVVAYTLLDLGLSEMALEPQARALAITRRELGDDHAQTMNDLNTMGEVLAVRGRFDEAEPYFRSALEASRRVLGNEHPDTLVSLQNLGIVLRYAGDLAGAETFVREALEISRRIYGEEHPTTIGSYGTMGGLLMVRGELAEAERHLRVALEGSRRLYGDEHPETRWAMNELALALQSQDEFAEAERYHREGLVIRRRLLGDDHPSTLSSASNLGSVLRYQGRLDEAELHLRAALEGCRRVLGDDHPTTIANIGKLGDLRRDQGRAGDAERLLREAMERSIETAGRAHSDAWRHASALARCLLEFDRREEALEVADWLIESASDAGDGDRWRLGTYHGLRGRVLRSLGRLEEAAASMGRAHRILVETRGDDAVQTRRAAEDLADLYVAWHEAEPAAGHDLTAAEWRARAGRAGDPAP